MTDITTGRNRGAERLAELTETRPATVAAMAGWTVETHVFNEWVGWTEPTGQIQVLAVPGFLEGGGWRINANDEMIAEVLYSASDEVSATMITAVVAALTAGHRLNACP